MAGEIAGDIDFGNQDPQDSSIGDFVWHDLDADGIQDSGEPGIDNVTVNLLDGKTLRIRSTTTTPNGSYDSPINCGQLRGRVCCPQLIQFQSERPRKRFARQRCRSGLRSHGCDHVGGQHQHRYIRCRAFSRWQRSATASGTMLTADGIQDTGETGLGDVDVRLLGHIDNFQDLSKSGVDSAPNGSELPTVEHFRRWPQWNRRRVFEIQFKRSH